MDYNSRQYWSDVVNLLPNEETAVPLQLDLLALDSTNDPAPARVDGAPLQPEQRPWVPQKRVLLASLFEITGLLANAMVGQLPPEGGHVRGRPCNNAFYIDFECAMHRSMPRKSRIDAPGALHHIICRGIERRAIFEDDADRDRFVERLATVIEETATPCYAWALIPADPNRIGSGGGCHAPAFDRLE